MIDLQELLAKPTESELLEFKEAKTHFDKESLGKYFSALCNEANLAEKNRAYLLFGVRDDKTVVGTSITDSMINDYKQYISENTSPTISFIGIERIATKTGIVVCCIIPAAPRGMPVSWKDHYYGRNGESLCALNLSKIERIRNQTKNTDWSIQSVENATIEDLSKEAIEIARHQYTEKNPRLKDEIAAWDDKTFLNKAKITINNKITNTAILLLGKPESEQYISPATATITWILKDKDNIEKDYEHFSCPLILSVEEVYKKIRNVKYRYIKEDTLFPEEVMQYEPYIIREALNNCIAHQDYTLGGRITVVENDDGFLVFKNSGSFIPNTIEKVIESDSPETVYRNPFLANAMVNLNMIDTIGSGIKKMFTIQKNKYFPLPDYDFSNDSVQVKITGKVLDLNFARKLATSKNLSLSEILLLDKIQKKRTLTDFEFKELKSKKLIEGRKNNYTISSSIAKITHQETDYMRKKGIDDEYCKKMILDYISKFGSAKKARLEEFLIPKLSDNLNEQQKKDKIKNILQVLKRQHKIMINPDLKVREWILVSSKTN